MDKEDAMNRLLLFVLCIAVVMISASLGAQDNAMVETGDEVTVTYTARVDGEIVDRVENGDPLTFTIGNGSMIQGFEHGIIGMQEGQTKTFVVPPQDAYGMIDPEAVVTVEKTFFPDHILLEEGVVIELSQLHNYPVTIKEVNNDSVVLDANHVLAGKPIEFTVTVVSLTHQPAE